MKSHLKNQSKSGRFSSFPFNHNGENWGRISQDVCKTSYTMLLTTFVVALFLFFNALVLLLYTYCIWHKSLNFCKKISVLTVKIRSSKNHANLTSSIVKCFRTVRLLRNSGSAAVLCLLFGLDPERPHFYKKWKFDPLGIPCGWPRWLMPNFSPLGNESELGGPHISTLQGWCTWTEVSSDPKLVDSENSETFQK